MKACKYKCRYCGEILGKRELLKHLRINHNEAFEWYKEQNYEIDLEYRIIKEKKRMTKAKAASVLDLMLYELDCDSAWIDFDSEDDDEIEKAEDWNERYEALQIAIKVLSGKSLRKVES